jgi:hypothetical protein
METLCKTVFSNKCHKHQHELWRTVVVCVSVNFLDSPEVNICITDWLNLMGGVSNSAPSVWLWKRGNHFTTSFFPCFEGVIINSPTEGTEIEAEMYYFNLV